MMDQIAGVFVFSFAQHYNVILLNLWANETLDFAICPHLSSELRNIGPRVHHGHRTDTLCIFIH